MKALTPYWFKPKSQKRGAAEPVEFQLQPIDLATQFDMESEIKANNISAAGAQLAFRRAVIGWRGMPAEFSPTAREEFLRTPGKYNSLWLGAVAGECYRLATLEEDAAKNS
jgi:hypothetical protein